MCRTSAAKSGQVQEKRTEVHPAKKGYGLHRDSDLQNMRPEAGPTHWACERSFQEKKKAKCKPFFSKNPSLHCPLPVSRLIVADTPMH